MLQSDVEAAAGGGGYWDDGWVLRRRPLWPGHPEHTHIYPQAS